MNDPRYVYTPKSSMTRQRMRDAQCRRLGIPAGHVQIYGIHVPIRHADPLRNWASWVRQKRGIEAAKAFVLDAKASGWQIEKPSPARSLAYAERSTLRILARAERAALRASMCVEWAIRRMARRAERAARGPLTDWALVDQLLAEGMSVEDIRDFTKLSEKYLRARVKERWTSLRKEALAWP